MIATIFTRILIRIRIRIVQTETKKMRRDGVFVRMVQPPENAVPFDIGSTRIWLHHNQFSNPNKHHQPCRNNVIRDKT